MLLDFQAENNLLLHSPEEVLGHWQGDVLVQILNRLQKSCAGIKHNPQMLEKEDEGNQEHQKFPRCLI